MIDWILVIPVCEETKNMNEEGGRIMLRQVIEKGKALSNHRYFQKRRGK